MLDRPKFLHGSVCGSLLGQTVMMPGPFLEGSFPDFLVGFFEPAAAFDEER
jgi:hypothetical protein